LPERILQEENSTGLLLGSVQKSRLERHQKASLSAFPYGDTGKRPKRPFFSNKNKYLQTTPTPDFGAFVRAQIVAQHDKPNPIGFTVPDGTKGRVWLASNKDGGKTIGDDRFWGVNTEELLRRKERRPKGITWVPTAKTLHRPIIVVGRNDPVRDVDDALGTVKGFRLRICIEGEKELQILGCGWRSVTVQFRGNKVLLHHNGSIATMKRKAFKELLAAIRTVRPKRRRHSLRLVVSNPAPSVLNAEAA
jgi:hypothetical protein